MTVAEAVEKAEAAIAAAGCDEPRADAEALVADALGIDVEQLSDDGSGELPPELAARVEAAGRPPRRTRAARLHPRPRGLPRPRYRRRPAGADPAPRDRPAGRGRRSSCREGARVHEIGTGSGAVALALLNERPDLRVTASDLSPEAAEVARENAERLGIDLEVTVEEGLPDEDLDQEIDLVLANLPYVTDSTIFERSPEIQREPRIAVTGDCGEDGLGVIRGVLAEIPSGWKVAFEHDTHHGPAMREMLGDADEP